MHCFSTNLNSSINYFLEKTYATFPSLAPKTYLYVKNDKVEEKRLNFILRLFRQIEEAYPRFGDSMIRSDNPRLRSKKLNDYEGIFGLLATISGIKYICSLLKDYSYTHRENVVAELYHLTIHPNDINPKYEEKIRNLLKTDSKGYGTRDYHIRYMEGRISWPRSNYSNIIDANKIAIFSDSKEKKLYTVYLACSLKRFVITNVGENDFILMDAANGPTVFGQFYDLKQEEFKQEKNELDVFRKTLVEKSLNQLKVILNTTTIDLRSSAPNFYYVGQQQVDFSPYGWEFDRIVFKPDCEEPHYLYKFQPDVDAKRHEISLAFGLGRCVEPIPSTVKSARN